MTGIKFASDQIKFFVLVLERVNFIPVIEDMSSLRWVPTRIPQGGLDPGLGDG
jgi:hypothetical protein